MIGLDTNVLARYLAQDDAKQAALATRVIEVKKNSPRPDKALSAWWWWLSSAGC